MNSFKLSFEQSTKDALYSFVGELYSSLNEILETQQLYLLTLNSSFVNHKTWLEEI